MTIHVSAETAKKARRRALRKKGSPLPPTPPLLAEADGVFFLTLAKGDRTSVAYTIERLIDMLDAMEPDPDLEPSIGGFLMGGTAHDEREADYEGSGPDAGVTSDDEPSLGWCGHSRSQYGFREDVELDRADEEPSLASPECHPTPYGYHNDCSGDQSHWAKGGKDDREQVCEDEGAAVEAEYNLGWQDEGSQITLHASSEYEADLGSTEEIDQVRRNETAAGWVVSDDDAEPDLGWAENHGRGITAGQNCVDDREHDDERQPNGDEADFSGSEDDTPPLPTSGRKADNPIGNALVERARRLRNGDIIREASCFVPELLPTIRGIPQLRASDFDRLPWADNDTRH